MAISHPRYWIVPVVAILLGSAACTVKPRRAPNEVVKPVVTNLYPVRFDQRDTATSFVSEEGKLAVVFLDLGDDVGLVLRSDGNTLLHVDVNQDGKPTPQMDRSYGFDFGEDQVCSWYMGSDPSRCGEVRTNARGAVLRKDGKWEVSFRVPKIELSQSSVDSWVMFGVYDVSGSEPMVRFPQGEPFQKVFRLVYTGSAKPIGVPDEWPGPVKAKQELVPPQPKTPPVTFSASRKSVYFGEQVCLNWDVPNVQKVTIEPGFGEFDAKGHQCFNPEKTMTITLRASTSEGVVEKNETIQVRDVEIESFEATPRKVRLGGSFNLMWRVKGASSLRLERTGSSEKSGSTFASSITSSDTMIRVNVTKKEFTPGRYEYKLVAEGPGGPKYRTVDIDVMP
jgi:hypothetical protein